MNAICRLHLELVIVMWTTIAIMIAIKGGRSQMKTVQMTLDENLVKAVDSAAKKLGTTRSAFTRQALRSA